VSFKVDPREDLGEVARRTGALLSEINPDRKQAPVRRRA